MYSKYAREILVLGWQYKQWFYMLRRRMSSVRSIRCMLYAVLISAI
jgi:hypothetical protein